MGTSPTGPTSTTPPTAYRPLTYLDRRRVVGQRLPPIDVVAAALNQSSAGKFGATIKFGHLCDHPGRVGGRLAAE